jgi:hypothetical protein
MLTNPLGNVLELDRAILSAIKLTPHALDIGPGIRPFTWRKHKTLTCLEPHGEYCDILRKEGFSCIQDNALNYLRELPSYDTIYLLDVIEHMEKEEGKKVIELAKEIARVQIILFTPIGFMPQEQKGTEPDAWGYNGWAWQTHKSGWLPEEFPNWSILRDNNYHETHGAFAAIWNNNGTL